MCEDKTKFLVAGIVTSAEFQRCIYHVKALHRSFPKIYDEPDVRPMLNLDWALYLTKLRRKVGGKIWELAKDVVVFINGTYLGDDVDLMGYLVDKVRVSVKQDFHTLGIKHLREILTKTMELGRKFAYVNVSIDSHIIGTMLFMLYADYVPKTVACFLRRCRKRHGGWRNRKIHRIVKNSWLQAGGFDLRHRRMACENYIVPHDRRGVLSTCNREKHSDNSTQFIVSLNPTPWMDYKFVAFGQLVQGDEVLRTIEETPTYYESPSNEIVIKSCGEFNLEQDDVDAKTIKWLEGFLRRADTIGGKDVPHVGDASSELSVGRYKQGLYCLQTDLEPQPPFLFLPDYLLKLYQEVVTSEGDYDEPDQFMKPMLSSKLSMSKMDVSFSMFKRQPHFANLEKQIIREESKEIVTNVIVYNDSRNLKPYIDGTTMAVNEFEPLYL